MIGRTLSHYKILEKIGAGGMGEVYLAEDTKLDRKVALKVLPPDVAGNEERRARFQREAKAIAALDHPNIVQVFSVEEADGVHFITMQLVRGKTLAELLPKNGLPLHKFLDIGIPLADAVAAAHQEGITHRDLKPDNIMVADDGRVKVLDFGLAKPGAGFAVSSEGPTAAKTDEGVIVGTVAYMSPEQAEGKPIDHRSDIFSLGIILYEMATGQRPFNGSTPASILSSIIKDTPASLSDRNRSVPSEASKIVQRCLVKDPEHRFQSVKDVRNELEELERELDAGRFRASAQLPKASRRAGARLSAAGALLLVLVTASVLWLNTRQSQPTVPRFLNPKQLTSSRGVEDFPTLSPNGDRVAFQAGDTGSEDIWVEQIDGGTPVNLSHDPSARDRFPAWSPDGSQIAFISDRDGGGVFVLPAVGGIPRKLFRWSGSSEAQGRPQWSVDGREIAVVYGAGEDTWVEILSVAEQTSRRLDLGRRCQDPSWSPSGRFLACQDAGNEQLATIWLYGLSGDERVEITEKAKNPTWSNDGRLLFFISGRMDSGGLDLWMQRLGEKGNLLGIPRAVTSGLILRRVALARDGTRLAYSFGRGSTNVWRAPVLNDRVATWEDVQQVTFDYAATSYPQVSSEGRLVVSSNRGGSQDLWILPAEGGEMRQLATHPAYQPVWSPRAESIAFERSGDIWTVPSAGGRAQQLTTDPASDYMPDWSPDGSEIAFTSQRDGTDIWVLSIEGGEARRVTTDPAVDQLPRWSPDGKWIAFHSLRSPDVTHWRVPVAGGKAEPLTPGGTNIRSSSWSPDGSSFFWGCSNTTLCALDVASGKETVVAELGEREGVLGRYGLASDGEFLYFPWQEAEGDIWVMDVVMNEE